jgi:hypothetical protein
VHYTVLAVIDLFLALASITDFILKFDLETENENEQLFANHFFVRQHYEVAFRIGWKVFRVENNCGHSVGGHFKVGGLKYL